MAGFPNDHFYYLSRATQVLSGAWPVRDFVDPGFPLAWAVSAAAQAVGGYTLLSEAVLVAAAFGIAAALTLWVVARQTGSLALALWAALVPVALQPRSYSYPKLLIYIVAAAGFIGYANRPSPVALGRLAVVTIVAFLFRHDHGIYIAAASCVLLLGAGEPRTPVAMARRLALFAAMVASCIIPYLIYVQLTGGVPSYVAAAMHFSQREAGRTLLLFPSFDGMAPWSRDALAVAGYYLFWATPVVALGVAWMSRRIGRPIRWAMTAIAVAALLVNAGFLRDPLVARVPDASVPFALLAAWVVAQAWTALPSSGAWRRVAGGLIAIMLITVGAAASTIGNFYEVLRRAEVARWPPRALLRWEGVVEELREPFAERQMPTDLAFALVPFFRYARECTPRDTRILVTGFAPEIAYYARRGFAGGHPSLYRGYYSSPADQQDIIGRLARERVLFVVASPEGVADFADSFPIVDRYVTEHFAPLAEFAVDGFDRPARIYRNRRFAATATDAATGWPCPGTDDGIASVRAAR